jgi:hypothetical protein
LESEEKVYKIDSDGYLLDVEGKYLLNSRYEQLKLSPQQIRMIKEHGFMG